MNKNKLLALFVVSVVLLIVPWLGKRHLADSFNNEFVQLGSAAALAICIGIGIAYGIFSIFNSTERSAIITFITYGFIVIFALNISIYSIFAPLILNLKIKGDDQFDKKNIAILMNRVNDNNSCENRRDGAFKLYANYGVQVVYRDFGNSFIKYRPTEKEENIRGSIIKMDEDYKTMKTWIMEFFYQLPILAGVYISLTSLTLIFTIQILKWKIQKKLLGLTSHIWNV